MPRPIHAACVHVVGSRQAERMCCGAQLLGVDEALRIGLVDEAVPAEEVVPRAVAWAQAQAALPPNALRRTRAIARRPLAVPFDRMDEEQFELFLDEWFSGETRGAMEALVARLKK